MAKMVFVLQLHEGKDREESLAYWRDVHGPMAAKTPGLRRYTQNHVAAVLGGGDPQFLGYAELWWDSREAFAEAAETPEWKTTIDDVSQFVDLSRSWAVWIDEYPIVD